MRVQVLFLEAGGQRYAVETSTVVEVVPAVHLRPVPGALPGVAGLFVYRGRIVPVVDLALLLGGAPCPRRLSSRILVCDRGGAAAPYGQAVEDGRRLGLLAEHVTRVGDLDPDASGTHPGPRTPGVPTLGRIVATGEGLVQLVGVTDLVSEEVLASLVRQAVAEGAS